MINNKEKQKTDGECFCQFSLKKRRKDILFKLNLKFSIKTFLRPRKKVIPNRTFLWILQKQKKLSLFRVLLRRLLTTVGIRTLFQELFILVSSKLDWLVKRPKGPICMNFSSWLGYFVCFYANNSSKNSSFSQVVCRLHVFPTTLTN